MIRHWVRIRRCQGHRPTPDGLAVHAYATVPVVLRVGPAEYEIGELYDGEVAAGLPYLLRATAERIEWERQTRS